MNGRPRHQQRTSIKERLDWKTQYNGQKLTQNDPGIAQVTLFNGTKTATQ